jgi:hypothetical protein
MRDDPTMRTTLDIDSDVLEAAKELGRLHGKTAGQILSQLAREALTPRNTPRVRNGVPLLPRRAGGRLTTLEDVNRFRDGE